ncbi:MAG TPA: type II toxin-antitoxin system RelE/ParE family toxin [Kiritimatiellia bacterium]|nr:type II toxin-antitoxin system RelE/ParE family toxin [Kiritimatiellia bacterium]HMP00278.1 type II toxin-antitoxin system RelE/ParE family toxin [Kiritimatiellia bacterium]HMP96995.1 type II toxin-antitoxin system RelE/ParE family toxin [Kiritimatiellia bacterium]
MIVVVWTDPAVSDLDCIHEYISRDAEVYADALVQDLFDAVDRLESFPLSGRVVPELNDNTTREVIVGSYRIIYDVSDETIRILSVLHGARQFPKH